MESKGTIIRCLGMRQLHASEPTAQVAAHAREVLWKVDMEIRFDLGHTVLGRAYM